MPTVLRKQYTFYKQMTAMKSHEVTTAFTPAFTEKRQPLLVLYCVIPLFSEATKQVCSLLWGLEASSPDRIVTAFKHSA